MCTNQIVVTDVRVAKDILSRHVVIEVDVSSNPLCSFIIVNLVVGMIQDFSLLVVVGFGVVGGHVALHSCERRKDTAMRFA